MDEQGNPTTSAAAAPPPSAPTPAPPPGPATQPVPAPAATPGSASGPGSSGAAAPAGVTPPPAGVPYQGQYPADVAQKLAEYDQLAARAREYDQYKHLIPLGYQAYRNASQPQPQVPQQPQRAAHPWGLPEFDPNLLNFVARGPDGQLQNLPGAPPDAAIRVADYQAKLREVQTRLFQDPVGTLGPIIDQRARAIADQLYEQRMAGHQQTQQAHQLIQENGDWLFASDAAGNRQQRFDPATGTNKPVLSPLGQQYARLVHQAAANGVTSSQMQHQFAVSQLQAAVLGAHLQRLQAGQQGQQAGQQFLAGAAPGAAPPSPGGVPPQPPPTSLTLRDRMTQAFESNGITDQVLRNQLTGAAAG